MQPPEITSGDHNDGCEVTKIANEPNKCFDIRPQVRVRLYGALSSQKCCVAMFTSSAEAFASEASFAWFLIDTIGVDNSARPCNIEKGGLNIAFELRCMITWATRAGQQAGAWHASYLPTGPDWSGH